MNKVTQITVSLRLREAKRKELTTIAKRLGNLRKEVWRRYGGVVVLTPTTVQSVIVGSPQTVSLMFLHVFGKRRYEMLLMIFGCIEKR